MAEWTANDIPNLRGRVVVVTGGNEGLGFESAKVLARNEAEVILACRSKERGEVVLRLLKPALRRVVQDPAAGALPELRAAVDPRVRGGAAT